MKTAIQDMLLKLVEGQELFDCEYSGQKRKCKILKLDFETEQVFVKFDKPVKKTIRVEGNREDYWGLDKDSDTPMIDKEIESIEEWITI